MEDVKVEGNEKKKRRKRSEGDPEARADKMYFNSKTQAAIVEFQTSNDRRDRERLYITEIMPAFKKLVENLINIHKFSGLHDSYDDLKSDCINFLFETIHKFDSSRGTNAFSYFNVVAKNWLIIKTKQRTLYTRRNVSVDDANGMSAFERAAVEEREVVQSQDFLLESLKDARKTLEMLYEIRNVVKTENELSCINSIITIFENIDDIDLLNKSAVLLYMRELSGLSPKQLTTAMQSVKMYYKKIRSERENE